MGDFDITLVLPVICLASYGLLTLLLAPWNRMNSRAMVIPTMIGLGMTGAILYRLWGQVAAFGPLETASGLVRIDGLGLFFSFVVVVVGALTVLVSVSFIEREGIDHGEFYTLVLFCLAGMLIMLQTTHLMIVLIGLEVFSLSLYVLTGLTRSRARAVESALKYFLLGAFSSGFIVYGMALAYGATGSLDLYDLGRAAAAGPGRLLLAGMGLVFVGLAFKVGAVPFHAWVPDVYQGAPTNVTGFMAAATKTVAFAVLIRFLGVFVEQPGMWTPILTWIAILTLTVANLVALAQTDLKRLLAFSSIAHAGYLLIALTCDPDSGMRAILFYLSVYGLMTVGAFAVLAAVGRGDTEGERGYSLAEWAGLGWRRPALGLAMTVFLVSLAGIPPTGGFLGKYLIFQAAVESDRWLLAVVGVINAGIAAYYYLRVIVTMYMRDPETDEEPLPVTPLMATALIIAIAGVFYLGLAPGRLLNLIQSI